MKPVLLEATAAADRKRPDMAVILAGGVDGVQPGVVPYEPELPKQDWRDCSVEGLVDEAERSQALAIVNLEGSRKQPRMLAT